MTQNIIRIHRPVLTAEERAKRMKRIKDAATKLLIEAQHERKRTYEQNHH